MKTEEENHRSGIMYACYYKQSREGEHFVPKHSLSYQLSGSLVLTDGTKEYASAEGSFRLIRRNQLLRFVKYPPANGEYKSLTIFLDQQTLKDFSLEYGITAEHPYTDEPVLDLEPNAALKSYLDSLQIYQNSNSLTNQQLIDLKQKEGLFLLLQAHPELKSILFDFVEPHKIDLEAFMNKNYHFNVRLERFAYLTGRSLATFKRDFEKIFNTSPHRWLLQKRLQEAYFLIKEKGKTASDVYLDLGFEDLSHFSFVFKKQFGEAPSKILVNT
jgi:AraC-like DNA-binding protein